MKLKKILLKIGNSKILIYIIPLVLGVLSSYALLWTELLTINGWLYWLFGLSCLCVLLLHVKSFFATDIEQLGFYYSRLYGMFFGIVCTSLIFLIVLYFSKTAVSPKSLVVMLTFVFGSGYFNFLRNNYSDLAVKHLLAKELIEKNKK